MTNTKTYFFIALVCLIAGLIVGYSFSYQNINHKMQNSMSMDHTMKSMTDNLKDKTGDDFDHAFLREMIVHHQGAIEMARMVLSTSRRLELIELANDIISAQTREIDMMKAWNAYFAPPIIAPTTLTVPATDGPHVACTMEAKICPDGSAVGRQGPNCEFSPCPGN